MEDQESGPGVVRGIGADLAHTQIGGAIKKLREALGGMSQERFARKLGTTTRTISRWESAETLSPGILSRLHTIAITAGAQKIAAFFESKLCEISHWNPAVTANPPESAIRGKLSPDASWCGWRVTPIEKLLLSEFLRRYRDDDKTIRPVVEELLNLGQFAD